MVGHLSSHPAGVLAGVVQGSYRRGRQSVGQAEEGSARDGGRGQTEEVVPNLHWGRQGPSNHLCRHRIHPWSGPSRTLTMRLSPPREKSKINHKTCSESCPHLIVTLLPQMTRLLNVASAAFSAAPLVVNWTNAQPDRIMKIIQTKLKSLLPCLGTRVTLRISP